MRESSSDNVMVLSARDQILEKASTGHVAGEPRSRLDHSQALEQLANRPGACDDGMGGPIEGDVGLLLNELWNDLLGSEI
jgi:hypothetical protein